MSSIYKPNRAFTLAELLVCVGIVFLVALVLVRPAGLGTRGKAERIRCVNNLKDLALAQRIFASDNSEPTLKNETTATAANYFQIWSNQLSTPNVLICPTDRRATVSSNFATLSNLNVSYFANLAPTNQGVFLFGD